MEYVALQVKTSYSILESLNHIPKLVTKAKELGYTSLAITDTNNMFGVMEFYLECKKNNIKPIIGIELKINDSKILLYAKNKDGYKNLIKLSTLISDRELVIDDLIKYKDNLILIIPISTYDDNIYNIYEDKFIGYSTNEEKVKIIQGIIPDIAEDGTLEYNDNIIIASDITKKLMHKVGFDWPILEEDYIVKYLEYLNKIGFLNFK